MKQLVLLLSLIISAVNLYGQDDDLSSLFDSEVVKAPVFATFKTTKLINANTIEQVKGGELDFRIAHRFDDIAGSLGGAQTMFGFDNVSDIRFSFDYGLTDKWVIGVARSNGAQLHRAIVDVSTKIKLLQQIEDGNPLALSFFGSSTVSTMKSSVDPFSSTHFDNNFAHRLTYTAQLILATKASRFISFELLPTYVHRNYVASWDKNTLLALGAGARVKFTQRVGLVLDYFHVFDERRTPSRGYYAPLGVGIEIETGGHVFHLLLSNNRSLLESQFISGTSENWGAGEFRFGFNVSRTFTVGKKKEKAEDN